MTSTFTAWYNNINSFWACFLFSLSIFKYFIYSVTFTLVGVTVCVYYIIPVRNRLGYYHTKVIRWDDSVQTHACWTQHTHIYITTIATVWYHFQLSSDGYYINSSVYSNVTGLVHVPYETKEPTTKSIYHTIHWNHRDILENIWPAASSGVYGRGKSSKFASLLFQYSE